MKKITILVTGATGFLGSHLLKRLMSCENIIAMILKNIFQFS